MSGPSDALRRPPFHGAFQIIRYNWPWYALGFGLTLAATIAMARANLNGMLLVSVMAAVTITDFWLISSVLASHWIYDHSPISSGEWMTGLLPADCHNLANFHAGLDETSALIRRHYPEARLGNYDFYDAAAMHALSIGRARMLQPERASTPVRHDRLALADNLIDAAFVVFSAHELRQRIHHQSFFREIHRCLRPQGHLIVVEHLRDGWNLLAFGPGAFHFLLRGWWLSAFSGAGFSLQRECRVTPFITVFHLRSDS